MTSNGGWFAARLLFESKLSAESGDLFEERLVLVRSGSAEDARKKAVKIGASSGEEYQNIDGETVSWTFTEILDLVELIDATIGDGSEVYHHFLNANEVEAIRHSLNSGSLG
jgi:hypothetical protein